MPRDADHTIRRRGGPHDKVALVAEGQLKVIGMFAVDDGEEDGVVAGGLAFLVSALAEDETEGVGGLMPRSAFFNFVGFIGGDVWDTGELERVGEVEGCEAGADDFCKSAAAGGGFGIGDVVVDEGFAGGGVEEHPVLFDLCTG